GFGMVTVVAFCVSAECNAWSQGLRAEAARRGADPADLFAIFRLLPDWRAVHPLPAATLAQVADHVEHVRAVAGIDHVGIGGGFDRTPGVPAGPPCGPRSPPPFRGPAHPGLSRTR